MAFRRMVDAPGLVVVGGTIDLRARVVCGATVRPMKRLLVTVCASVVLVLGYPTTDPCLNDGNDMSCAPPDECGPDNPAIYPVED